MAKENASQGIAHNALIQGTLIKGDVFAEGDFRIDGVIEGNIDCKGKVVVGAKGETRGKILCENAELHGKVDGTVEALNNVSLKQTSVFHGEMITKSLDIEPGATFNGTCKMTKNEHGHEKKK